MECPEGYGTLRSGCVKRLCGKRIRWPEQDCVARFDGMGCMRRPLTQPLSLERRRKHRLEIPSARVPSWTTNGSDQSVPREQSRRRHRKQHKIVWRSWPEGWASPQNQPKGYMLSTHLTVPSRPAKHPRLSNKLLSKNRCHSRQLAVDPQLLRRLQEQFRP